MSVKMYYKNIKLFLFILIICFIIFAQYYSYHFVSDAYRIVYNSSDYIVKLKLIEGRPIQSLYFFIIDKLNISINSLECYLLIYRINLTISIILISIIIFLLFYIFRKKFNIIIKKHKIFIFLVCLLFGVNISVCEYLLYIENFIMIFSIILTIIASNMFFSNNKYKKILSFFLLVIASFGYQGVISIFVSYTYLMKLLEDTLQNKKTKKSELYLVLLKILFMYFCVIAINFIFIRVSYMLLPTLEPRIENDLNIIKNFYKIMFFWGYYIIFLGIPINIIILCINKVNKRKIENLLYNTLIIVMFTIFSFCVFKFGNTANLPPRLRLSLFIISSIVLLYYYAVDKINDNFHLNTMYFISIFILILQILASLYFQKSNINSTLQNQSVIDSIINRITYYEKNTGIEVENIEFYEDETLNKKYWNVNIRIYEMYTCPLYYGYWCDIYSINVLSGRNFNRIEDNKRDKNMYDYFKSKNWDELNLDEQMVFNANTVSICRF